MRNKETRRQSDEHARRSGLVFLISRSLARPVLDFLVLVECLDHLMSRIWTSLFRVEITLIRGPVVQHHSVAERAVDIVSVEQRMSSHPGQLML